MDLAAFAKSHVAQITGTIGLISYAILRKKLTIGGIFAGIFVAMIHMAHPWPAFFWLLIMFFLFGTVVTKVGHEAKEHLTQSATGSAGGEGARSSTQVFANSGFACVLIALHAYLLSSTPFVSSSLPLSAGVHVPALQRVLPVGIVAQYAAVAADTFSSELGILAKNEPFLITSPWKRVPKGTNGGVTVDGLLYGGLGSLLLTAVATATLIILPPNKPLHIQTAAITVVAGFAGSVIDSVIGALSQVTVTDKRSGKVIEGAGGKRVLVAAGGGRVQVGRDWLTNNGVNFTMAATTSILAMGVTHVLNLGYDA